MQWESSRSSGCRAYPVYKSAIPFWETVFPKKEDGGLYWVVREGKKDCSFEFKSATKTDDGHSGPASKTKRGGGAVERKDRGRTRGSYASVDGGERRLSGGRESERESGEIEEITVTVSLAITVATASPIFSPPLFSWDSDNEQRVANRQQWSGRRQSAMQTENSADVSVECNVI